MPLRAFSAVRTLAGAMLCLGWASAAAAAELNVAVAANFTEAAREIAAAFEASTGDHVLLSFGSTGQLYTQITQGAPFVVFLAADDERPNKAVAEGLGVAGSVFTYAVGKLALWSSQPAIPASEATLRAGQFEKLALANPKTAPYGAAAVEVLTRLGLYEKLAPKLVQGTNIAQTHQYVAGGSAELGFVALSQVIGQTGGSLWMVPELLYKPIRQDAVLLKTGAELPSAKAFLAFLKGPEAAAVIAHFGYGTAGDGPKTGG